MPALLGSYEILRPIATGGNAKVFVGRHRPTGRPVALKVVGALDERSRSAFQVEVRAAASTSHANLLAILDFGDVPAGAAPALGVDAGTPWLAMELADGSLAQQPPRSWAALLAALRDVLAGLAHAHARGLVHRDLKPPNVLRLNDRHVVADFGIALRIADGETFHTSAGTAPYMAPEQIRGHWRDQGPWTDLYSLGCMAWELACGRRPFQGEQPAEVLQAHLTLAPRPFEPRFEVPDGFEAWLHRAIARAPQDRFACAADASRALDALAEIGATCGAEGLPVDAWSTWHTAPTPPAADEDEVGASRDGSPPIPPTAHAIPPDWRGAPERVWHVPGAGLGLYGLRAVPLAGREAERDALWAALREVAREGRPRVITLTGPAGIGKTRLMRWLGHRALEVGAALTTVHLEPGVDLSRMARASVGADGLEGDALEKQVQRVLVGRLGERDPEELAAFRALCVGRLAAPVAVGVVLRHLRRLAQGRVLVLGIRQDSDVIAEDGNAADELLRRLEDGGDGPICAVLCTRNPARARGSVLPLEPMAPTERTELVAGLLGMDAGTSARLLQETEGVPGVIIERLRAWIRQGRLIAAAHGFRLAEDVALADEPAPPWARAPAARIAAALGVVRAHEWQRACVAAGAPWFPGLADQLLDEGSAVGTPERWIFRTAALRRAVLGAGDDAARLHLACARALADDPMSTRRRLRHLLAAGDVRGAVPHVTSGLSSADHLADLDEWAEVATAAGIPGDDPSWARYAIARASACCALDRKPEALAWADRAVERAQGRAELLDEARRGRGNILRLCGRATEAVAWLAPLRAELGPGARLQLALAVWETGDPRGARDQLLPLLADDGAPSHVRLGARHALGRILLSLGELEEAERTVRQAVAEAADAPLDLAYASWRLGMILDRRGAIDEALACLRRARALFRALGSNNDLALVLGALAELARRAGELEEAEAGFREELAILERTGFHETFVPRANLGLVALARGRPLEASRHLEAALAEAEAHGAVAMIAVAHALLLPCATDPATFDRRLDEAVDGLARTGLAEADVVFAARLAAERWAAADDPERARRAVALAIDQATRLGDERTRAELISWDPLTRASGATPSRS